VKPSVLGLAAALSIVAIAGKLAAAAGAIGTRADKLLIGLGMIPRGEVGLIFASIGLTTGVVNEDQYGALLIVVLVTTVITPPLLRLRLGRVAAPAAPVPTPEPPGGWLTVAGGEIRLAGVPPLELSVPLALRTAALTASARPSGALLDWFAAHRASGLSWRTEHTPALVRLLRDDNPRAWRFLDATGVLERALPEIATAMQRRRADISDLDPIGALRFPTVDRLDDLAPELGLPGDDLVLAALVADVCRDTSDTEPCAMALSLRLVNEVEATRITRLVSDAALLRAGAHRPGTFEEHELLQLATHLAGTAHARDSYQLALALGPTSRREREALDEQLALLIDVLDHPELTGSDANNLAGARRIAAEHLLDDVAAIARLRHAPNSYLLAHDPPELARQARLLEPLPRRRDVRVTVSPEPEPNHWKIDVACRDSEGLLARLTDVLTAAGFDIAGADIATWPDGAVLDSFLVRALTRPSAKDLARAFETRLRGGPLQVTSMPDLVITFENAALPWHTSAVVTGPDRPGALLAVSAAFTAANVVVHSARISGDGERVNDRFTVTDRVGRKLDAATMERVGAALAGAAPRRRLARATG